MGCRGGVTAFGVTDSTTRYGVSSAFLLRGKLLAGLGWAFGELQKKHADGPTPPRLYGMLGMVGASLPALWK